MGVPLSYAKQQIAADNPPMAKPAFKEPAKVEHHAMKRTIAAKAKSTGIKVSKPKNYRPGPIHKAKR
jgi:hypothetical protein